MRRSSAIFSRRTRSVVLGVTFLSFFAAIASLLYGGSVASPTPGTRDSYGRGPLGHHAFVETMKALGFHVFRSREGRYGSYTAPVLFLEPNGVIASIEGRIYNLHDVLAERDGEGLRSIVVLPKWRLDESGSEPTTRVEDAVTKVLGVVAPSSALKRTGAETEQSTAHTLGGPLGTFRIEVMGLQTAAAPDDATILLEAAEGAVLFQMHGTHTYVLTDPDLLHSFNIQRADHATLLKSFLEEQGDTLVIDEVFHGHGRTLSIAAAMGGFPAVLIAMTVLMLLLLLTLLGLRRFGPPEPERRLGHGPKESIRVSAAVLAQGQPLPRLVNGYVEEVLLDIGQRIGLSESGHIAELLEHLDAAAHKRGVPPQAEALLRQARALLAKTKARPQDGLRIAQAAHAFRHRMIDGGQPRRVEKP